MRQARIIRNIWLGIENLLLHKLRSFLTMLGVVFGVGSVVAMLSVGEGASKDALDQIRRLGSNNIIISSMKPAEQEQTTVMRSSMLVYGLTYNDHQRMAASLHQVYEQDLKQFTLIQMNMGREVSRRLRDTDNQLFRARMVTPEVGIERSLLAG